MIFHSFTQFAILNFSYPKWINDFLRFIQAISRSIPFKIDKIITPLKYPQFWKINGKYGKIFFAGRTFSLSLSKKVFMLLFLSRALAVVVGGGSGPGFSSWRLEECLIRTRPSIPPEAGNVICHTVKIEVYVNKSQ